MSVDGDGWAFSQDIASHYARELWCPRRPAEHAQWEREQSTASSRSIEDGKRRRAQELASLAARTTPSLARDLLERPVDMTDELRLALEWVKCGPRGLLIRGGVGAGKSYAAASIARVSLGGAAWYRPSAFVSAVLHAYDEKSPRLHKYMVVVDDLGRETNADFPEALCAFIDDTETRFVLTTNLTKEQFRQRYADLRLIDRLNDCAQVIPMKGASRRKQGDWF